MIKLTKLALKRPVTVILSLVTIAYFGLQSLMGAKVELTPEMELPMLVVGTLYAGAAPEDVNDLIIVRQEDAISSLDSVDTVYTYAQENLGIILVQYEYGTNMDTAYINLKKAIDSARIYMPDDMEEPLIMELDLNAQPVITLAVNGETGENLYTYVDNYVIPRLEKLSSVGEVSISGGQKEYIRIELIPERLDQYHLNMNGVVQLVGAADYTIPAGEIEDGSKKADVSVGNEFGSAEQLKNLVLPLGSGDIIRLGDIAFVYDALEEADSIGRYNGSEVISISIKKQQDATAIETSVQVMNEIGKLKKEHAQIDVTVIHDSSEIIRESIANVVQTMMMAVILSMIILWLFYGDLRASVIVGTSIPVSIMLALICMSVMGFSMNIISLTSLVLGVGMMVDNSINVLDGCLRAKPGRDYYDAAVEGTKTMIGSITGGTVTTCVVFLPLAMISGISGQIFTQLGYTIVFCMLASLFSAVILVPLCYYRWHPAEREQAPANRMIRSMQEWYRKRIPSVIPRTSVVFSVCILLMAAAFRMASDLPVELISAVDEGIVGVTVKVEPGLSVDAVNETVREIEAYVAADQNVDHYLLTYGNSGLSISTGNQVILNAYLKDDRSVSTGEVIRQWRRDTQYYQNVTVAVEQGSTVMSGSVSGGDKIELDLQGTDYDQLKDTVDELVAGLRERTDIMQVHSSIENAAPVVNVQVDPVKAQAEGLVPANIGSVVYNNLSGVKAATIRVNGEDVDVRVEFASDRYHTMDKLQSMMITTASGTALPLDQLADIRYADSPQQIVRKNKQYQVAITMQPQAGYERTAKEAVQAFVRGRTLPAGIELAGNVTDEMISEELGALAGAIGTGIFLIFIVMAIQFESPKYSWMVMATIPFSFIGSFGLLYLADSPISMVSMIGFLMLFGTVVNNGILYVETVNQMLAGSDLEAALTEAGAIRMRPILMTALTTVIAMLPNAFAYGKAGKIMQGLALVNVGGLTASTILTLVLLPTFYRLVYRLGRRKEEGRSIHNRR